MASTDVADGLNAVHGVQIMYNEFDVAVVGGGPVGLRLASELALGKVRAYRPVPRTGGPRTLEVFALRGLADRFISRGRTVPTMHFGALDTRSDLSVFD
jgi:2-polyprenyl-6-methoxyphenol hydroxylase-like FAD-dependent oxidoreductase